MSRIVTLIVLFSTMVTPAIADTVHNEAGTDLAHKMVLLVLQLSVIIFLSRFVGVIVERHLKQPAVLGELAVGCVLGPYALGSIPIPGLGPLFPKPMGGLGLPISPELYGIATLASIVLLFLAGLETDLATFIQYSVAGSVVGIGGVVVSFGAGAGMTVLFGFADSFMDPLALFMGTISTATSVGITARILSERRKIDSPEGVSILAGAVIDDVLGIIVLAVVVGISRVQMQGGHVDWAKIGIIGAKALGFWFAATALGLALARKISSVLKWFQSRETMGAIALGFALLMSGLAEKAGLAMIIGAYVMGLSLSRVDVAHELRSRLSPVYNLLVPIFFCVMGMLVNFAAMKGVVLFGLAFALAAALAKITGCGISALFVGFNLRGALRIGSGMLPRGEVTLIVAGVGLSSGILTQDMFGVVILTLLLATLSAPPLLVRSLEGGSGLRGKKTETDERDEEPIIIPLPNQELADFMLSRILSSFRREDFFVHSVDTSSNLYHVRKEDISISIRRMGKDILFTSRREDRDLIRLFVFEEVATLQELLSALKEVESLKSLSAQLLLH